MFAKIFPSIGRTYLAECLLKAAAAFIWPVFIDLEFAILPKPVSKIGWCVNLLKQIMNVNQYSIHQWVFKIMADQHSLTIVTVFLTTEKLCLMVTMTANIEM